MSAISFRTIENLIADLRDKMGKALAKTTLGLTEEEFLRAFIVPEHIEKLAEVHLLTDASAYQSAFNCTLPTDPNDPGQRISAGVVWLKRLHLLVPKYVERGIQHGNPASDRVIAWAAERRRVGMLVGDAIDALRGLNEDCETLRGLSLVFPAVLTVMASYDDGNAESTVVKRARAVSSASAMGRMPSLDTKVVNRVREASAVVQALYMALDAPDPVHTDATVVIVGKGQNEVFYTRPHILGGDSTTTSFV